MPKEPYNRLAHRMAKWMKQAIRKRWLWRNTIYERINKTPYNFEWVKLDLYVNSQMSRWLTNMSRGYQKPESLSEVVVFRAYAIKNIEWWPLRYKPSEKTIKSNKTTKIQLYESTTRASFLLTGSVKIDFIKCRGSSYGDKPHNLRDYWENPIKTHQIDNQNESWYVKASGNLAQESL